MCRSRFEGSTSQVHAQCLLLEQPVSPWEAKRLPTFYWILRLVTVFATAHHWPLSRAILIYSISVRSVLIVATNLRICLLGDLPSGPLTKPLKNLTLISSDFCTSKTVMKCISLWMWFAHHCALQYEKLICYIKDSPADEFQDAILSCPLYHVYFLTCYSFLSTSISI